MWDHPRKTIQPRQTPVQHQDYLNVLVMALVLVLCLQYFELEGSLLGKSLYPILIVILVIAILYQTAP